MKLILVVLVGSLLPSLSNQESWWSKFHNYRETKSWLEDICKKSEGLIVRCKSVGESKRYDGQQILGVHIRSFIPKGQTIIVESGMFPQEIIGPAATTYLINELINSDNQTVRRIAQSFNWYIFPIVDPDGKITQDERTDKNERVNLPNYWSHYKNPCDGGNPNQNWDLYWSVKGASNDCIADNYPGKGPFSLPLMKNFSDFIKRIAKKENLVSYISIGSYGGTITVPYVFTREKLDNLAEALSIARVGGKAYASTGTEQPLQAGLPQEFPLDNILKSGVSTDWVKAKLQIPLVYSLRIGRKEDKYNSSSESILPVGRALVASLVALLQEAERRCVVSLLNYVS